MARPTDATRQAALDKDQVHAIGMVYLGLSPSPLYLHTDMGDFAWNGHTWQGVGGLGSIEPLVDDQNPNPNLIRLGLRYVSNDSSPLVAATVRDKDAWKGHDAEIYYAAMDYVTGELQGAPSRRKKGYIQSININPEDGMAVVSIIDGRIDMGRTMGYMFSNAEQQERHPGDFALKWMADAVVFDKRLGPDGPRANRGYAPFEWVGSRR